MPLPSRRNLLAYPAGFTPGFDPTHVAAQGCYFSSLPSGDRPVSLLTGLGANSFGGGSSYASSPDATIGPNYFNSTLTFSVFSGLFPPGVQNVITMGAIFKILAGGQGDNIIDINVGGWTLRYNNPDLQVIAAGVHAFNSAINLANNTPYFVACSANAAIAQVNIVVVNLLTGQVQTDIVTNTAITPNSNSDASAVVGELRAGTTTATMAANSYLSLQQLLAWARDPWAFWYPSGPQPRLATQSYPQPIQLGGARVRQRWNRNPLAYPQGVAPGFDPSHTLLSRVGMGGMRFSGIATNANFVDLMTGLPGGSSIGSTTPFPQSAMDATLGLTFQPWDGNTLGQRGNTIFTGKANPPTMVRATIAAIFGRVPAANEGPSMGWNSIFSPDAADSTRNFGLIFGFGGGPEPIGIVLGSSSIDNISFNTINGHSYFVIISVAQDLSLTRYLILDMNSGEVRYVQNSVSWTFNTPTNPAIFDVGYNISGWAAVAKIAAVAYTDAWLSQEEMLACAADPWSFWYPRRAHQIIRPADLIIGGARVLPRLVTDNSNKLAWPGGS